MNPLLQPTTITTSHYELTITPLDQLCSQIFMQYHDLTNHEYFAETFNHYDFNIDDKKSIVFIKLLLETHQYDLKLTGNVPYHKITYLKQQVLTSWNLINPSGKYPAIAIKTLQPSIIIWLPKLYSYHPSPPSAYHQQSLKDNQSKKLFFTLPNQ